MADKKAHEKTTIKTLTKELKLLEKNCNTAKPEKVKLYIANKTMTR
jgi:hypothetical protein